MCQGTCNNINPTSHTHAYPTLSHSHTCSICAMRSRPIPVSMFLAARGVSTPSASRLSSINTYSDEGVCAGVVVIGCVCVSKGGGGKGQRAREKWLPRVL